MISSESGLRGVLPLLLLIAIAGCSGGKSADENTKERPPIAVEALTVLPRTISEGIEVTGSLSPKFESVIRSEVQGIVDKVNVTEWVRVKKGDPLAELDTREEKVVVEKARAAAEAARASLAQARAAAERAQREWERISGLKDSGLVTRQNLDDAETELAVANARLSAAKAQVLAAEKELSHAGTRLDKTVISAPMEGVISLRGVNPGDLVGEPGAAKPMFVIVDDRVLDLTVTVPSTRMAELSRGQTISFTTDAEPERTYTGIVTFVNPLVNEADRSIKVTAEVDNTPGKLKGGLFVKGRIVVKQVADVLLVPRLSLSTLDLANRTGVLMTARGNVAKRTDVSTGLLFGDQVEITEGLAPGDTVLTRGAYHVGDGDRIEIIETAAEK